MTETVVTADGVRLWAETTGAGPHVAFCHGGPGLWDYLEPLSTRIGDDITSYRFDQRGCARSTGADGPFTIVQAVEDLDAVRRHFGLEQWSLLGHSWGAELVLRYAAAYPERTLKVAYVSGVGAGFGYRESHRAESARRLSPEQIHRLEELDAQANRSDAEERERCILAWLPDFSPSADREALAAAMFDLRLTGAEVNEMANRGLWLDRATIDLLTIYPQLAAPVLMVHGRDDPPPFSATDSLLSALPRATRVIIDNAGHEPWAEQPEQTAALLRSFLTDRS